MTLTPRARRWAVGIGLTVLAVAAVWLTYRIACPASRGSTVPDPSPGAVASQPANVPVLQLGAAKVAAKDAGELVRGVVLLPDGRPAPDAIVALHRARTAWPEWDGEQLDRARTGDDGAFQFRVDALPGLFVEFTHAQFAGAAIEVPWRREALELRLEPGFELDGLVTNDVGAPVPNARVALESVPGEQRRVTVTTTAANGRYAFKNLRAGPVRLVARHESWQPVVEPTVVVGDQLRVDLRCERPAMTPLRGRVVSAANQAPIAGALVQLLPLNQQIGLCDPSSARTGADGTFLLTGLSRGNLRLLVRHPDHGSLPPSTQRVGEVAGGLLLELPSRSTVSGQLVVDEPPALFRGGELLELTDFAGQVDHAVVAPDGSFRFAASMSPGKGTLRLLGRQFAFQRSRTLEELIVIDENGATVLEIAVVRPTSVRGKLVDAKGAPLAGAQVVQVKVFAESARTITQAAEKLDLSTFGKQVVQLFGSDRDELLATTEADGSFEIRGLVPGDITVRFALRGHARLQRRIRVPGNQQRAEIGSVELPRAARLQGRVHRGERGIGGVSVTLLGREAQAIVTTDRNGRWTAEDLVPGRYRVQAKLPFGVPVQLVEVPAGGAVPMVDTPLEPGRSVRGVVVGSQGRPLPGAAVSVLGTLGTAVTTDAAGAFTLELPPRANLLQITWGDRNRPYTVPVGAVDGPLRLQLETPPTCTITARVLGLPGQIQLPGGLLRLSRLDGSDNELRRSHWVDFSEGELRWPFCPTGLVRIEIACDGFVPFVTERMLTVDEDEALGQVWLEPGARLQGIVVDAAGNPVANAVALLGDESDLDLFEARTRTGSDGTFRLGGVSARSSQLVVRAPGFAPSLVDLQLPYDALADRQKRVALELGSTIRVAVGQGREGIVQLRRDGRVLATSDVDLQGFAWFPNRAAGVYTVQLDGQRAVKSVVVEPGAAMVLIGL